MKNNFSIKYDDEGTGTLGDEGWDGREGDALRIGIFAVP
jgi:hypothetical protein